PPPAAGADVLTGFDSARAGGTADTGVILVMETVVRDLIRLDVGPDVVVAPLDERVDLQPRVPPAPFDGGGVCASDGLVLAQACHPRGRVGERALQRLDFADGAALLSELNTLAERGAALLSRECLAC